MQDQYFTFNMFDAQAWYVRDVILDRIELPITTPASEISTRGANARKTCRTQSKRSISRRRTFAICRPDRLPRIPRRKTGRAVQEVEEGQEERHHGLPELQLHVDADRNRRPPLHDEWMNILDDSAESFLSNNFGIRERTHAPRRWFRSGRRMPVRRHASPNRADGQLHRTPRRNSAGSSRTWTATTGRTGLASAPQLAGRAGSSRCSTVTCQRRPSRWPTTG